MEFGFEDEEYAQNSTQKQNRVVKEFVKPPKPQKPSKPLNEKRFVYLLSKKERQKSTPCIVNVTSRSEEKWSTGLSPFYLGPVQLYDGMVAQNVENAWQFSKVYEDQVDENLEPSSNWWSWAKEGFAEKEPKRFPMGRGAKPLYSYWNGEKLGYVDARIKIYAPVYGKLVEQSEAFKKLKELYKLHQGNLALWDFDGYDFWDLNMTLEDVLYEERKKMGHAFVLAMLLKETKYWEQPKEERLAKCNRWKGKK